VITIDLYLPFFDHIPGVGIGTVEARQPLQLRREVGHAAGLAVRLRSGPVRRFLEAKKTWLGEVYKIILVVYHLYMIYYVVYHYSIIIYIYHTLDDIPSGKLT